MPKQCIALKVYNIHFGKKKKKDDPTNQNRLKTDHQQQNREFLDISPHDYLKIKANLNSSTNKGLTNKIPQEKEFTI